MDIRRHPKSRTAQHRQRSAPDSAKRTPVQSHAPVHQSRVHPAPVATKITKRNAIVKRAKHVKNQLRNRAKRAFSRFQATTFYGWLQKWYRKIVPEKVRNTIRRLLAKKQVRLSLIAVALLLLIVDVFPAIEPYFNSYSYKLDSTAQSLLSPDNEAISKKLVLNTKDSTYEFNSGYTAKGVGEQLSADTSPRIMATLHQQASKGVTVNDPVNKIDFKMTPKFGTWEGKKSSNKVMYPLKGDSGWLVYTMHGIGVKEDIVLTKSPGNEASYAYDLGLADTFTAKLLPSGGVGIYGNTMLSGNVATGSDKDAALLQKARKNAPKNKLLFSIPAPTIVEPAKRNRLLKLSMNYKALR